MSKLYWHWELFLGMAIGLTICAFTHAAQVTLPAVPLTILPDSQCTTGWTVSGSPGAPTITCGAAPPPGFCSGYTHVIGPIDVTWGQPLSRTQTFGDGDVWLFRMVVPSNAVRSSNIGTFNVVEVTAPTIRQMTISESPCDYRANDYTGANGPLSGSQGVTVYLQYNTLAPQPIGGIAGLTPGKTYYVSVRDFSGDPPPGHWTCGVATCTALMNAQAQGARSKKPSKRK